MRMFWPQSEHEMCRCSAFQCTCCEEALQRGSECHAKVHRPSMPSAASCMTAFEECHMVCRWWAMAYKVARECQLE
eukprot:11039768-Lingulodinium_polyedra.AAC.1